jgi:hypothetical protein
MHAGCSLPLKTTIPIVYIEHCGDPGGRLLDPRRSYSAFCYKRRTYRFVPSRQGPTTKLLLKAEFAHAFLPALTSACLL